MYFSSKPANFKFYAICLIKESYNFLYFLPDSNKKTMVMSVTFHPPQGINF